MLKKRNQVAEQDKWNVEVLYPNFEAWNQEFEALLPPSSSGERWPEILAFKGKLKDPETVKKALEAILKIERKLTLLYTYAHLRHDEDLTNDEAKTAFGRILAVLHDLASDTSWFEPEILSLPQATLDNLLKSETLKDYHFYLEKMISLKDHHLTEKEELLMALAGKAMQAPHKAFSAINDADFKFGTILDSHGKEHLLTHGTYSLFIRSQDRELRKNAFNKYLQKYQEFENTLCELLNGQIQKNAFNAKVRNFSSSLEAALKPNQIEMDVYHALIESVNARLGSLHRYLEIRKKILGLDTLHHYDLYVPLTKDLDIEMPYKEAEEIIITSTKPLGQKYQDALAKGFKEERWVDRYENENKRSGAYSSGCYDSVPYILMNYKNVLRDVSTLAHEAGHSIHSLLSKRAQPYHYADYPIFVAEVASTFNEELLMKELLKKYTKKEEQIFLINQKIEDIRGTLFRQTLFAEFELLLYTLVESNTPLTPQLLREEYRKLNEKYYGSHVEIDPELTSEWSRIPHFYYNFYVYQYATGISAALALAEIVQHGGDREREAYLTFLSGGGSDYPVELLRKAGVDIRTPEPVNAAIDRFDELVNQLEILLLEGEPAEAKK